MGIAVGARGGNRDDGNYEQQHLQKAPSTQAACSFLSVRCHRFCLHYENHIALASSREAVTPITLLLVHAHLLGRNVLCFDPPDRAFVLCADKKIPGDTWQKAGFRSERRQAV